MKKCQHLFLLFLKNFLFFFDFFYFLNSFIFFNFSLFSLNAEFFFQIMKERFRQISNLLRWIWLALRLY